MIMRPEIEKSAKGRKEETMITQRIDKIALDIEQGIDTAKNEARIDAKNEEKSSEIESKEEKPQTEAIAAKSVTPKEPEPVIEEEQHYHRGR